MEWKLNFAIWYNHVFLFIENAEFVKYVHLIHFCDVAYCYNCELFFCFCDGRPTVAACWQTLQVEKYSGYLYNSPTNDDFF